MSDIFLLGIDSCMELEDVDWLRDATEAEAIAFRAKHNVPWTDQRGRAYWLKVLLPGAPQIIKTQVSFILRTVRLVGDWHETTGN